MGTRKKLTPEEQNEYFIKKILSPCPFEFKKVDGIWYKRIKPKKKQTVWREIVFSPDSKALDIDGLY